MRRSFVALALALVLPLPAFAGQVTVKEGETLSEIADRYGLSVNQLMKLNDLSNADHVESGQSLKVPGATGGRSSGVSASGRVTVRDGETLSEIADRHGMSVNQLMKLNGLSNADHVESGQALLVSGPSKSATTASGFRRGASEHVVQSGESLSVIADGYGIGLSKLIAINAISDPDHVEAGTRLKLKGNPPVSRPASPKPTATKPASTKPVVSQPLAAQPVAPRPRPASSESRPVSTASVTPARSTASAAVDAEPTPETRPSATPTAASPIASRPSRRGTAIASAAATSTEATAIGTTTTRTVTPVAVRPTITSRPVATVATAPRAATTAVSPAAGKPDWRTYGPLQVDWTGWQPMGGSMVAPTLNAQGQSLYTAINCGARKLNATTPTGDWKTWDAPSSDFELQLVNDYCRSRS
jgi:LysM repeat protein